MQQSIEASTFFDISLDEIKVLLENKSVGVETLLKDDNSLLHIVCAKNLNMDVVQYLIEQGGDINQKNSQGLSPLYYLCRNKNFSLEILKLVTTNQPDWNVKDGYGNSPLCYICLHDKLSLEIVRLLIENYPKELTSGNRHNYSPLHWLCQKRSFSEEILQLLIANQIDLSQQNENRLSSLSYICQNTNFSLKMLELLIENCPKDLASKNIYGESPLDYILKNTKIFKDAEEPAKRQFLKNIINQEKTNNDSEKEVFIALAVNTIICSMKSDDFTKEAYFKIAVDLLKKPNIFSEKMPKKIVSDVIDSDSHSNNIEKDEDFSLLQWLCLHCNNVDFIKLVTTCYGENLSTNLALQDGFGRNCFHLATLNENLDVLNCLLELNNKEIFLHTSSDSKNVLHFICQNETVDFNIICRLIKMGVDPHQKDNLRKSPLDYLRKNKSFQALKEIEKFIEQHEEKNIKIETSNNITQDDEKEEIFERVFTANQAPDTRQDKQDEDTNNRMNNGGSR